MKIARVRWLLALATLGVGGLAIGIHAQQIQQGGGALEVLQVQPNFYMIAGAGGNIAVQVGPDGVVLVDAGSAAAADQVVVSVRRLTEQPIRYIINTSADPDHVGGNEKIAKAGVSLFATGNLGPGGGNTAINNGGAASIIGTEKVLLRMSAPTGQQALYPSTAWPTETFTRKQKNLYLNREGIEVI